MKTNYEVCAVGPVVETIRDDLADLCDCSAKNMGQERLRGSKEDSAVAKRIALLWNLFSDISDDDVERLVGAELVIVPRVPNHNMTAPVVPVGGDRSEVVRIYTAMVEAHLSEQKGS